MFLSSRLVIYDVVLALGMILATALFTSYMAQYASVFVAQAGYNIYNAPQTARARYFMDSVQLGMGWGIDFSV